MPILTVKLGEVTRAIPFAPGISLREILEGAGFLIRTGCRGNGACGLCLVRIEAGDVHPPTSTESLTLAPQQLAENLRLACQITPNSDLGVRIVNPVSKLNWRDLAPDSLPCTHSPFYCLTDSFAESGYGLAIDLGTTQISLSLWDLKLGSRLHSRQGPNPQAFYGSDVITRLLAADESAENARRLARLPLEAIAEALQDLCAQDNITAEEIVRVALVGNTAMLALLTEADPQQLLQPGNWTRALEYGVEQPGTWLSALGINPQASLELASPLAGFVGSDLLAGVVATGLTEQPGSLLLDFGTNSEMALWDGRTLWVTSAAGGPAFECCGIECGMPAEPGAIHRFGSNGSQDLLFQVLGGSEAKGFCGSGLVDLIACLLDRGALTRMGAFTAPQHRDGYVILDQDPVIRLTKRDVDTFQRAKAAIGAGIGALLAQARMNATEVRRICVCGVFGQNLDVRNAQRIGLLPHSPRGHIDLCGNTALAGCERLLLSQAERTKLMSLRERAVIINLAQDPDFEALFLECLYLEPTKVLRA